MRTRYTIEFMDAFCDWVRSGVPAERLCRQHNLKIDSLVKAFSRRGKIHDLDRALMEGGQKRCTNYEGCKVVCIQPLTEFQKRQTEAGLWIYEGKCNSCLALSQHSRHIDEVNEHPYNRHEVPKLVREITDSLFVHARREGVKREMIEWLEDIQMERSHVRGGVRMHS